ncbi:peptidyl-prolyl cis-trans isomerase putative (PAR45) [Leptomonas pyrrhocoris]|uniref:Peptidyl-prolyl cis-trans isomerase putative (PAR45) n=1 Tax=Leptomonas pyrrhocoris TaxID=157538 RepID=A0A0M9G9K9_LEPPY|nr:peptidyl-prolyl cis-trans isomerase putative (PAR45) [Leptomonas pyrrhocoris]KPA85650.1 peptidyl-prolyl cis-trans isomerase putative (PAR45) [Leptomonas pyrrhocoris]|eukprot:XP_015664089.1 peptidyl-prolyl cis-trans isomerase putative (PAR45) [Leptomonas pyrrhocoris]
MSDFQAHVARLARAAETASREKEQKPPAVAVALSESAQSLPPHIIAATDPIKLNKQAPIFRCPAWAGLPSRPFHLHCERGGVVFPALALHRFPYYLFGKNDVCDYVLEHPSISSVHAALIFNKEHECFVLLDLGSTNGTRLHGKRVEARRPVPITVGSIVQFGYSTRTYELRAGTATAGKRTRDEEGKEAETTKAQTTRYERAEGAAQKPAVPSGPLASSSSSVVTGPRTPAAVSERVSSSTIRVACATPSTKADTTARTVETATPPPSTVVSSAQEAQTHEAEEDKGRPTSIPAAEEAAASEPAAIHLYQLVIKHKDVDNPISRGHNKGEVITRSKADALEMARFIVKEHQTQVPVNSALGFSPWTVEEFVTAVKEFCEVSHKKKAGDLGMVEKGTFSDAIDDAAFRLRRGEVSVPVETQLGVHLLFRCD